MVGIDALSQQTSAIQQLSEHHAMPVSAVHAPCLLFTQRVWGTEPWGKLERSAEMAHAVGAEVVVVHPPFRWQKTYARDFVDGIAALEASTGLAFAVENMYPWRASSRGMEMYLPGWDPSAEPYANTTIDLSHAAIAQSDVVEMAERLGERLCHVHLTDGSGSAKDEHLVPGRGMMNADGFLRHLAETGFDGEIILEINTRKCADRTSAKPTCGSRWSSRASTRACRPRECPVTSAAPRGEIRRGRRPGGPDTRAAILAAAREMFAAQGFAGTSVRAVATKAGVDAALVHHYFGTKDDLFLAALAITVDPRVALVPVIEGGVDGAGERLMRLFVSVWDDEETRLPLLAVVRGIFEPGGQQLVRDGFLRMVLGPLGVALELDQPERRMQLVASQLIGLVVLRHVLAVEPLASAPGEELVATYAPTLQRYLSGPLP